MLPTLSRKLGDYCARNLTARGLKLVLNQRVRDVTANRVYLEDGSVVYVIKLPRLDRKVRVLLDWTLDLFFPRDINLLSPCYSMLFKEIHLEKGDVLFRRDEPAFFFYIVKEGAIEMGDEQGTVTVLTAGEYFGERALMGDGIWRFNAVAKEPSTLVSIPANLTSEARRTGSAME